MYTSLPTDRSLYLAGLNTPVFDELVMDASYGFGVLGQVTDKINAAAGGSKRIYDFTWFNQEIDDRGVVANINGAPTLSGTQLTVPVSGDVSLFRIRDIVSDRNKVQGRVVGRTASAIIIEPVNVLAFSTSTHFQSNGAARVLFDASGNRCSTGKESITHVPTKDFGYIATTRNSSHQCKREQTATYAMTEDGYWYTGWDKWTMNEYARQREYQILMSERTLHKAGTKDEYMTTGGLRWSIINNGGTYLPLSTPLTQSIFHEFISEMMLKTTNSGRRVVAFMGQLALANIQGNITNNYIQQAGDRNTFGGTGVSGLNVMKYAFGGMEMDFVILPILNNTKMFPEISAITNNYKEANSIYFMDLTPTPSWDGQGERPTIEKRHFGERELYMEYLNGVGTDFGRDHFSNSPQAIVSDVAGREFHLYGDNGLYITGKKCGLIELAG